jgi:hypothetical protein
MRFPFEATPEELEADLDGFVDAVFTSLESEFLVMPRGEGFVEYPAFEDAFQELKRATGGFSRLEPSAILEAVSDKPLALIVLRTILGFTPPEWAHLASLRTGVVVTQGYARSLDRRIRKAPSGPLRSNEKIAALIEVSCRMLTDPLDRPGKGQIHRLDKADTLDGSDSVRHLAKLGVPYPMLLYERFLGRPFAAHRDSVSELIGDRLEAVIEEELDRHGIAFRKMKRAERIPGFDQTPDFVAPDEFNPKVVIEAKVTEDDGTARDKITRVQHLAEIGRRRHKDRQSRFEVIACIAGRGFGIRREDMKKLILATQGKVFSLATIDQLVRNSALHQLASS